MRWPPWRRAPDTTAEAREHLARLEQRDERVAELGEELRAVRRRNHFSEMVDQAIIRAVREGP